MPSESTTVRAPFAVEGLPEAWLALVDRLAAAGPVDPAVSGLVDDAVEVWHRPGFETLLSLGRLAFAVLAAAHELMDQAALRRREELSVPARKACAEEQARAEDYYAAQITTLRQRLEVLPEEKKAPYQARIEATEAECERRLAEIVEKYAPGHDVRPFRALLVRVPAVHLPAEARRDERRHALRLDYLTAAGEYAGMRCPACSSTAPLVLAKTGFGCETCIGGPKAPDTLATRPATPATTPRPQPKPAAKTPPPASRRAQAHTGAARLSTEPAQRVIELWQAVADGDRAALDELCEPGSPAAIAVHLLGPGGLPACLQLPATDSLTGISGVRQGLWRGRKSLLGTVDTRTGRRVFTLFWSNDHPPRVEELLPSATILQAGLGRVEVGGEPDRRPLKLRVALDPVAGHLWAVMGAEFQLPLVLRALAALWRIEDLDGYLSRYKPRVLAAALDRLVGYWSQVSGATFADAATRYGVAESAIRTAGGALHRELKLTREHPW